MYAQFQINLHIPPSISAFPRSTSIYKSDSVGCFQSCGCTDCSARQALLKHGGYTGISMELYCTSRVETEDERTSHPDQQCSLPAKMAKKTQSPLKRKLASSSKKAKVPRISTQRKTPPFPSESEEPSQPWKTKDDPDEGPKSLRFFPKRLPGSQVDPSSVFSPLELFKTFFSMSTVRTLCENTNSHAAKNICMGKKSKWTDITPKEFYTFLGLVLFIAQIKARAINDYWKRKSIFSIPFPGTVMNRDRYKTISWNIHMSDPDEDVINDRKKGTPEYDKLFRLKPLMDEIRLACMASYHPHRNLAVDERMVASQARNGLSEYIKAKPNKFGFKLFVLADSSNGYTVDYAVYIGKNTFPFGFGICYDAVMSLVKPSFLGSGYHVYLDNYYSSPKLFKDLFDIKMGACGIMREGRQGFPKSTENALTKKSPRGTLRWIREGSLLFVKWKDARDVSVGSTIHQAYGGETIKRKKNKNGKGSVNSIPVPTAISQYNKYMGGVDLSNQLITYFSAHRKTKKWYRTFFYHFVDIATTNSYIIHKEMCKANNKKPMTHKEFMEQLVAQLCEVSLDTKDKPKNTGHTPVPIKVAKDKSQKASFGRKACKLCITGNNRRNLTPWKCNECGVPLCVIPDRNCFHDWHNLN
uniref:PiggyBac transposable element-derived protein domain-containing protein n=1 Tax=Esox lucius TaxID=8010 RepID=A0AAY5K092_ESOLU